MGWNHHLDDVYKVNRFTYGTLHLDAFGLHTCLFGVKHLFCFAKQFHTAVLKNIWLFMYFFKTILTNPYQIPLFKIFVHVPIEQIKSLS